MSLAGCQINPIDVNFHLQKGLEIFEKKISCQKSDPKSTRALKGWKVPCSMPIRVKVDRYMLTPFLTRDTPKY
jgi:hypothetical protein